MSLKSKVKKVLQRIIFHPKIKPIVKKYFYKLPIPFTTRQKLLRFKSNILQHDIYNGWCEGRYQNSSINKIYLSSIKYRKLPKALRKEAVTIALSGMFDEKFYLEQYPDVRKTGVAPLNHFIKYGWKEGRNPNKDFNTSFYLNTFPDIREIRNFNIVDYSIISGFKINENSDIIVEYHDNNIIHLRNKRTSGGIKNYSILLRSYLLPSRFHAGGLRVLDIYSLIRKACPNIKLDLYIPFATEKPYANPDFLNIFDNIFISRDHDLDPLKIPDLKSLNFIYDIIDIQFYISPIRLESFKPFGKKVIYTPMESYIRYLSTLTENNNIDTNIERLSKEEILICDNSDLVVCVSEIDALHISNATKKHNITWLDTCLSEYEFKDAFRDSYTRPDASLSSKRALFVAYFYSQTNIDSLKWYLNFVHHLIKEKVPDYIFEIVGKGDFSQFDNYKDDSVIFTGEVPLLFPCIEKATLGISPALYGSGFRGKINQYAIYGVPCVASPLAINGLSYKGDIDSCIAENPSGFADKCIRLLTDLNYNKSIGQKARKTCLSNYIWDSKWNKICDIYNFKSV